ncbi:hypothetical protein U9M48_029438, partial [Paspalum notatum var. saurae]
MFLWRLANNSLPVRMNIAKRGIETDTKCPMCARPDEDCGHLFLKCKFVKQIWGNLDLEEQRLVLIDQKSALDFIELILSFKEEIKLKVIILIWCWWNARNKANQGEKRKSTNEICSSVVFFLTEMQKLTPNLKALVMKQGVYKINCDGSFLETNKKGSWGCVIRNHSGEALAARAGTLPCLSEPLQAESMACLKGIELAELLGMQQIILETDSQILTMALSSDDYDRAELGVLFREIR